MFLLDALLIPFAFVDGEAIEECGGLVGFELGFFFEEGGGDEEFVIRQPLGGIGEAGGVFENRHSPFLTVENGIPVSGADHDAEVFRLGFEVGDEAGGIAGFERDGLAARGEGALDVDGVEIGRCGGVGGEGLDVIDDRAIG